MSKKQYKVHIAYVNSHNTVIPQGIYTTDQIDLAEARYKSVVTCVEAELNVSQTTVQETPTYLFNMEESFSNVKVEPAVTITKIERLKINSATAEELRSFKYITASVAEKVIAERKNERFNLYSELNKRVPLKFGRIWEDIAPIDFEPLPDQVNNSNSLRIFGEAAEG